MITSSGVIIWVHSLKRIHVFSPKKMCFDIASLNKVVRLAIVSDKRHIFIYLLEKLNYKAV